MTRLTLEQEHVLEQAKEQGFLVCEGRQKKLFNAWVDWCRKTQYPLIWVQRGTSHCSIHLDMVHLSWELSDQAVTKIYFCAKVLCFAGFVKRGKIICGSPLGFYFSGVATDEANEIASFLLSKALACKPKKLKVQEDSIATRRESIKPTRRRLDRTVIIKKSK